MTRPKLYLIDAHAYIHRAYHALPPLHTSTGLMVNAAYGFTKLLFKIVREKKPDHLVVCFDHPAPANRKKIYPAYKATRKPVDEDLKIQFPVVKKIVDLLGFASLSIAGYEADDLIAALAKIGSSETCDTIIVTGDKDALQLVSDNVVVWNVVKDQILDPQTVETLLGIKPEQIVDYFALMGDASDNIPGVPGVGKKTALKLIQEFRSLDEIYANIARIPEKLQAKLIDNKAQAYVSRDLVTLDKEVPISIPLSGMPGKLPEAKKETVEFFQELGFKSLLNELRIAVSDAPPENKKYAIISDEKALQKVLNKLQAAEVFALDVETTGLNTFTSGLIGISLSCEKNNAWYVPVQGAPRGIFAAIKNFLEQSNLKIIGHNLKFDYLMLMNAGINLTGIYFDTMLASYLLNPSRSSHRLKSLALDFFSMPMTEYTGLVGKGKNALRLDQVDLQKLGDYACADADATYMLYEVMHKELENKKKLCALYFDVEIPLLNILAGMEKDGIKIDTAYLNELSAVFGEKIKKLEKDIYAASGEKVNINSPKQLAVILFDKLKLPVIRRTKTGFSTDDNVLEELSAHHELPRLLRSYRELQKLKSTYVDALMLQIDPDTSRLHTSFNQAVTATGRLSSSDPNLQNIPVRTENGRMIRKVFIPEDGSVFLSADYSQIDLRVLAHLSQDNVLVDAFNSGGDIHKETAAQVFGVPAAEVTDEMRNNAKAINFGIVYGQQAFGLAQTLKISRTEAQKFIDNYFVTYAGVKIWIEETLAQAETSGSVSTLLGRIRYLPELQSDKPQMKAFGQRLAMNTPIQGSASDIIKVAMVTIGKELSAKKLQSKMLLQIHDDLLFEVKKDEFDQMRELIKEHMEHAVELSVPLIVDMKRGANWRDLEKI
ncbi:MAG: DNA polymerase I [bacterium]